MTIEWQIPGHRLSVDRVFDKKLTKQRERIGDFRDQGYDVYIPHLVCSCGGFDQVIPSGPGTSGRDAKDVDMEGLLHFIQVLSLKLAEANV